jgi:hypothetical protein
MGIARPPSSDIPAGAFGWIAAYEEARPKILEDAHHLRRRAALFGMLDEVIEILSPLAERKRKRGGQTGSRHSKSEENDKKQLAAYLEVKEQMPGATAEIKVIERLIKRKMYYGKTKDPDAVLRQINKVKARMENRALLEGPRKRGRPNKIER